MTADEFARQTAAHAALLAAAEADVKAAAAKAETTRQLREAVRAAFDAGMQPKNIVKASGLSRTTVYEIRDGK